MMIGGGGDGCNRADHGIGITEADSARFGTGFAMETLGIAAGILAAILSICGLSSFV